MTLRLKQSLGALGIIAGLGTLVVVLAVLQFKWSNQLSNAEWQQQQATLQTGMNGFREDLHREISGICSGFTNREFSAQDTVESLYAQHCGEWARTSDQHDLVSNFYLWEVRKGGGATFLEFNPQSGDFQAETCPQRLGDLCDTTSLENAPPSRGTESAPPLVGWRLHSEPLAMVHPLIRLAELGRGGCPPDCVYAGLAIVELNRDAFLKGFLPELAQRYFGGPEGLLYQVAIVDPTKPPKFIYSSEPKPSESIVTSSDDAMRLFSTRRRRGPDSRSDDFRGPGMGGRRGRFGPPPQVFERPGRDSAGRSRGFFYMPVLADASAARWQLVVQHRSGSLREAVAATWRRNLLLSLGILLILAVGMGLVLVWTRRIQNLAKLQMDVVTGVSHELRTPVSVICSAAENLADGVVDSKPQVKQYGALIRNEGQRLSAMIEQVMLFAATRDEGRHYQPQPVPVNQTIDSAVADLSHLTSANGFTVEKDVAPDLPPVLADPKALGRCLQNLMTNALKYGASGRWMSIRAHPGTGAESGEVLITVADRGQGIEPEEIPHIFEPFYRGNAARASQIHGTGLGLSLAKEAAEAMGGKLTVTSSLGEGSSFTLHFPAAR
jgi:signal transduction histidine kinase